MYDVKINTIQAIVSNFRDIAEYCQTYVQRGKLYRSGSPIAHQSPRLKQLFKDVGIKCIIDLRSAVEIGYEAYHSDFLRDFNYFWVHLDISMPLEVIEKEGVDYLPIYQQFCWFLLHSERNKQNIKKIFTILADESNYNILMHCFAGRDRTGVISALILNLMNVPETNIVQDYLASDEFTDAEDILYVLEEVDKQGGIEKYLLKCGVSMETQKRVKTLLAP